MPYPGVPDELTSKMESCVTDVMAKGHDKDSAIAICHSSVVEGNPLEEALEAFEKHKAEIAEASDNPDDYLIVDDPEKKTTWHLQVKQNGKPDHRLMGAAWAALHGGYRGNKYEGPDKQKAIDKLKALYNSEEMPLPGESDTAEVAEAATVKSKVRAAIKALDELLGEKEIPDDMRTSVKSLRESFKKKWADLADEASITAAKENFAESYSGMAIIEDYGTVVDNPDRAPLTMKVQLIRPGWGNAKDNHYYPPEVLRRDAHVFEGKKMYTTDHKENEKSERTEVSMIEAIEGFTDDGAPIARVKVFDPAFAEKVRNREKAGLLDKLECSVLGSGTARPFELDGRKGKMVESITDAESVDWVTRAGAGGHALEIAESQNPTNTGGNDNPMGETTTTGSITTNVVLTSDATTPVAEVAETPAPAAEPTRLSEVEVSTLLEAEKRLPAPSRERLAESAYSDSEAVKTAITKELAYLAKLQGSGQPFGLGAAPEKPKRTPTEIAEAVNSALDKVNDKYLHNKGGK